MNKLILITGGSASGKSYLANLLAKQLGKQALVLTQDSFYKANGKATTNYDEPSAFDFKDQHNALKQLVKKNQAIKVPIYDFKIFDIIGYKNIKPTKYIIFEGLFTFYDKTLNKLADLKIYVDTPPDICLARRIIRDVKTRNRKIETITKRWINDVKPAYQKYIFPLQNQADIIIPWQKLNNRSLQSLIGSIKHLDKGLKDI